jgi:hypothetical protein
MTSRLSTAEPILALLAIALLLLVGAYLGGYMYLGEVRGIESSISDALLPDGSTVETAELVRITRVFLRPWQVSFFRPAAIVEGLVRRIEVKTMDEEAWQYETMTDSKW